MYAEVTAALNALNAIRQIAGGLKQVADDVKGNELRIEIQSQVIEAQAQVLNLQSLRAADTEAISKLTETIGDLHRAQAERKKYKLRALPTGQLAYFAEEAAETGEPAHWVCQPCLDAGSKMVLQPFVSATYGPSLICAAHVAHRLST